MDAMDRRQTDLLLKLAAGALTVAGVIVVLIGYLGVRDHDDLVLQMPYVVSGGLRGGGPLRRGGAPPPPQPAPGPPPGVGSPPRGTGGRARAAGRRNQRG